MRPGWFLRPSLRDRRHEPCRTNVQLVRACLRWSSLPHFSAEGSGNAGKEYLSRLRTGLGLRILLPDLGGPGFPD
jgi:hypothetical protein